MSELTFMQVVILVIIILFAIYHKTTEQIARKLTMFTYGYTIISILQMMLQATITWHHSGYAAANESVGEWADWTSVTVGFMLLLLVYVWLPTIIGMAVRSLITHHNRDEKRKAKPSSTALALEDGLTVDDVYKFERLEEDTHEKHYGRR